MWPQLPMFLARSVPVCEQGLTSGGVGLLRRVQLCLRQGWVRLGKGPWASQAF